MRLFIHGISCFEAIVIVHKMQWLGGFAITETNLLILRMAELHNTI